MISSKWIATIVQGLLVFLTTQPYLFTADYLIRTKNFQTRISTVLIPAFVVKRGSDDYVGFIPELLAEMKIRNGVKPFEIFPAAENEIGRTLSDGNWTGVIQEVLTKVADIGVGPILDSPEHMRAVVLSKPWATVGLTLVLKKSANVTSLREALDKLVTFYVVNDSVEAKELRKVSRQQGSSMITTLQSSARYIRSVYDGLTAVAREDKAALVLNSEEARYHVAHDFCQLVTVPNFLPLGNYTFAFPSGSLNLDAFNKVLLEMKDDGSLEALKKKTLGVPGTCSNAMLLHPGTAATFLLAAVVSHFRF